MAIHHKYDKDVANDFDFAVGTIDKKLGFSDALYPACLPYNLTGDDFANKDVYVSGWGELKEGGKSPNKLQYVKLKVVQLLDMYLQLSVGHRSVESR